MNCDVQFVNKILRVYCPEYDINSVLISENIEMKMINVVRIMLNPVNSCVIHIMALFIVNMTQPVENVVFASHKCNGLF